MLTGFLTLQGTLAEHLPRSVSKIQIAVLSIVYETLAVTGVAIESVDVEGTIPYDPLDCGVIHG